MLDAVPRADSAPGDADLSFAPGHGGGLTALYPSSGFGETAALAIQEDGKVLSLGTIEEEIPPTFQRFERVAIVRRLPNGMLDPSFGLHGVVTLRVTDRSGRKQVAVLVGTLAENLVLARTGDTIATDADGQALENVRIKSFGDPVAGGNGHVAFPVALTNRTSGFGYKLNGAAWSLLLQTGAAAGGGGRWLSFDSLVIPKTTTGRAIFTARLARDSSAGITSANDRGVWMASPDIGSENLTRTGDLIEGNELKTFEALLPSTVFGSGLGIQGAVPLNARFKDGTQGRVEITLP